MSIKSKRTKEDYKVLSRYWNFFDLKKDDFVSFSMTNDIDCKSFKWVFLAQRCSFVCIYIYNME